MNKIYLNSYRIDAIQHIHRQKVSQNNCSRKIFSEIRLYENWGISGSTTTQEPNSNSDTSTGKSIVNLPGIPIFTIKRIELSEIFEKKYTIVRKLGSVRKLGVLR